MNTLVVVLAGLLMQSPATSISGAESVANRAAIERARTASSDLGRTLKGQLVRAMGERGVAGAVDFCQRNAQRLTAEVGNRLGVRMGRVGTRTRNPVNAPDGWRAQMIRQFAARAARGEDPGKLEWVSENADHTVLRYARGIGVQGACLACHGTHVAADVKAAIDAAYPQDEATGYRAGDLRGAFWVEVPIVPGKQVPLQ
jgi:hypothetical protein